MSQPLSPATHSAQLLQSYALQLDLSPSHASAGARLDMLVDERYRVRLQALPTGGVQIRARLRALPEAAGARELVLTRVAQLACGMMKTYSSTCVVDAEARALWLQQTSAASTTHDIDAAVDHFVNALTFWIKAIDPV
jgi:hypothetical protein